MRREGGGSSANTMIQPPTNCKCDVEFEMIVLYVITVCVCCYNKCTKTSLKFLPIPQKTRAGFHLSFHRSCVVRGRWSLTHTIDMDLSQETLENLVSLELPTIKAALEKVGGIDELLKNFGTDPDNGLTSAI